MSTAYGMKTLTLGTSTIYTCTNLNISCAIVQNESPYTLTCKIDGTGSSKTIGALTIDRVDIPMMGFNGNLIFTPLAVLSNTSNAPSYAVLMDTYGIGEEPTGSYPVGLSRAVVVTGDVNSNVTSTNLLQNTGNPPLTTVINVQPTDTTSATIFADNSGNFKVYSDNAGTLKRLIEAIAGASTALHLGDTAVTVEVFGPLQADGTFTAIGNVTMSGTLTVGGATILQSTLETVGNLQCDAVLTVGGGITLNGGDLHLGTHNIADGNAISISSSCTAGGYLTAGNYTITGNGQFQFGSSGAIKFRNGNTLVNQSFFTGTGSGTYNHGCGQSPFHVMPIVNVSGSATQGYDTVTSTQVHVTLGSSLSFKAFCLV